MKRLLTFLLVLGMLAGFWGASVSHATIASITNHIEYTGTNSQTIFPYTFKIYAADDLKVYLKESGAYTLQTLNIDYTVSGVGVDGGGNVTMTTAPATSQEVIIYRGPPLLQSQQYVQGGPFPARSAEDSLDKIVMEVQALNARAIKTPAASGLFDVDLPLPAPSTNGLFLRWNAAGTGLEAVTQAPTYAAGCPVEMVNAKDYGDGTVSFATLQAAKAAIGSNNRRLYLARGDWPITSNFTLGSNISVVPEKGARLVATNATLTIQGPIEAGPYQIFSWTGTGTIDLTASPTKRCYLQWWGATPGTYISGADISPFLLKAYESSTSLSTTQAQQHDIVVTNGIWWLSSNMTYWVNGSVWPANLVGEDQSGSVLYMNLDSATDGICIGGKSGSNTMWTNGCWIKNLTVLGAVDGCRHAFNLQCWNSRGGMEKVNLQCGSASSAIYLTSVENCTWDVKFGPISNKYSFGYNQMYGGIECVPVTGVGYEQGAGTYNHFKIQKTFCSGMVYALKLFKSEGVTVEGTDIEACSLGEVQSYYVDGSYSVIPLYTGGITRIGQTFTLSDSTQIDNLLFSMNKVGSPQGVVTVNIYATSAGAPTSLPIYTSWQTMDATDANNGNPFDYRFLTAMQTFPAGTYFADVEFSGGDASNYVGVSTSSAGTYTGPASTCYTYSGSWSPQTYTMSHAINVRGAVWLNDCSKVEIGRQHMEANRWDYLIEDCQDVVIMSGNGNIDVRSSSNISLLGDNDYKYIMSDPSCYIILGCNRGVANSDAFKYNYGLIQYQGFLLDTQVGVEGNGYKNILPNTLLDRWQSDRPAQFDKSGTMTWTKCGDGLVDTTRHPLTPFCAKLVESSPVQDNWHIGKLTAGPMLDQCKGRWVCWSAYLMFPSGQTFTTSQYWAPDLTIPIWQANTQYEVGDATNDGTSVCVQAGESGATIPSFGAPISYTVDGTCVWLNGYYSNPYSIGSGWSDDTWRRISFSMYIPKNATAAGPYWQWYGQAADDTTAYLALPQINFGRIPSMAPDPMANEYGSVAMAGLHLDTDAYIPTNASSKLYGLWASVGDRCKNDGTVTALASGAVQEWGCTVAGTNGTDSTWAAVSNVP